MTFFWHPDHTANSVLQKIPVHTAGCFQTYQGATQTEFPTTLNIELKESFQKLPQSISSDDYKHDMHAAQQDSIKSKTLAVHTLQSSSFQVIIRLRAAATGFS
jgi:hypothetical protein